MSITVREVKWAAVIGLLVVAAAVVLWTDAPYDIDDAPITYRYAENLAMGNGFVYNAGERVQGTSTPLYTLLLAAARVAGQPVTATSNMIGLASSLAVVALTLVLVHAQGGSFLQSIVAGLIVLCQPSFLRYTMAGMETPLYTMLIMLSLVLLVRKQYAFSAASASLAALTRLDGLIIVATIWLFCALKQKRLPIDIILLSVILLAPWYVFATAYFGSPLPLSMLAKQQHLIGSGASRFWIWEWLFVTPWRDGLYLLPFVLIGLVRVLRSKFDAERSAASLVWLAAYLLAYTAIGIPFYEWYVMPAYPVLAVLTSAGLASAGSILIWLYRRVSGWRAPFGTIPAGATPGEDTATQPSDLPVPEHDRRWGALLSGAVMVFSLIVLLPAQVRHAYSSVTGFKEYLLKVEGTRVSIGQWLRDNTPVESEVLTGGIGHIGYESKRYVIDSAGLVSPGQIRRSHTPDYFVLDDLPEAKKCGVVKEFATAWPVNPMVFSVTRCFPP